MLKHIFNPKTIALIGASEKPKTVGSGIASNLLLRKNKIFFVNPNKQKIFNKKSYKSVLDIKENIDLVIIAVPCKIVNLIAKECVQKRVKGVIVISAGFSEVGNLKQEEELKEILDKADIPLIGPNCLGIINPKNKLNASFAPFTPKKGGVALLSQSGALIDAVLDLSKEENYGFSKIISFGNEAGIGLSDYLDYLSKDKDTKVIAMYLEGVKDGQKFLKIAKKVTKLKPVIVLKSGKSNLGQKATLTHTGALAGNAKIYSSVFRQTGIIEVESLEELLDTSKVLAWLDRCKNGVGIITNGGGFGVLATDYFDEENIKVPSLKKDSLALLETNSMKEVKVKNNPLDLIGDALSDRYEQAIKALIKQKDIHCLLIIQGKQIMTEPEKTAKIITKLKKKYNKPIVCSFVGRESFKEAKNIIERSKIPNIIEIKRAVRAIKHLIYDKK